jgi:SAM-dependent methyltransferase
MIYPLPKPSDYKGYLKYLSHYEYEALKPVNADFMVKNGVTGENLLDMACWDGTATRYYGDRLNIPSLYGADCEHDKLGEAKARGVDVRTCDFETQPLPFPDGMFDVVVANQIFEHLKQIYRPISEVHRVLKPGGYFLFSVPNLGALHCRIQLLLGKQPSTIKVFEAHVRAFSIPAAREFLTLNDHFEIVDFRGSGLYPFPPPWSERLSRVFNSLAVFQVYLLRKREGTGPNWQEHIVAKGVQSNF